MKEKFQIYLDVVRGRREDDVFPIGRSELKLSTVLRVLTAVVIAGVMYIVGLIAEFLNNHQAYEDSGGMAGGVLPKMEFNIFVSYKNLFTTGGLRAVSFVIVASCIIAVLIKYHNSIFDGGDYDERGFRKTKNGTYGTADWITEREVKQILEIGTPSTVNGTILGEKDGKVYCMPESTRFNKHIMIFGASGTMKSRAIIRNHIFQGIKRGESFAITDPKGELFSDTYELFKKNGYNVQVLNLVNPENGNSWNCMSDLGCDTLMTQTLTNIIIGNTSSGKGDHFWDNGEGNLLKALILYVDYSEKIPPERKNLATVYELLTSGDEKKLLKMFDVLEVNHPAKAPYSLFAQSSDQVKAGIILGLGTRLQVLQNEAVKNLVSHNEIDLTSIAKEKTAFFVILSDQDATMKFLSSLFFTLLFIRITRYADNQPDRKCSVPVNLVLDEFNNIGRIGGAEDGSDFARTLSVIRSRDVRVMIAVQSLGQLQNRYANNLWAEILGNCDIQLMLGCTDDLTAEYISNRSGEMSIQVNSTRRSRNTFALFEVVPQYQETQGEGKRMLLTPDEVLTLDPTDLLIICRGHNLLQLKKFDYSKHPMSKEIVPAYISDYTPTGLIRKEPVSELTPEISEADDTVSGDVINIVNPQTGKIILAKQTDKPGVYIQVEENKTKTDSNTTFPEESITEEQFDFGAFADDEFANENIADGASEEEPLHRELSSLEKKLDRQNKRMQQRLTQPGSSPDNPIRIKNDGTHLEGF